MYIYSDLKTSNTRVILFNVMYRIIFVYSKITARRRNFNYMYTIPLKTEEVSSF